MSTTAAQRPPTRPTSAASVPKATAGPREFQIRFNSTAGPLALLRRPQNTFGWVGAGAVLLEHQGIRVSGRRLTMLGLRRTSRLIETAAIREVYREGAAIQIDSQADGRRCSCRFWAADARQAAEIVRLLPTTRTIELDGAATAPAADRSEPGVRWSLSWFVLAAVLLVALAWIAVTRLPVSTSAPPQARTPQSEVPLQAARLALRATSAQSQVGSPQARQDLTKFTPRFKALTLEFSVAFDALQMGNLSQQEFANGLERWLLPQWDVLAAELSPPAGSQANSMRADADVALKGAIDSWRQALPTYARGLRNNDHHEVLKAFGYIADAEGYEQEARDMLDRLNTP